MVGDKQAEVIDEEVTDVEFETVTKENI